MFAFVHSLINFFSLARASCRAFLIDLVKESMFWFLSLPWTAIKRAIWASGNGNRLIISDNSLSFNSRISLNFWLLIPFCRKITINNSLFNSKARRCRSDNSQIPCQKIKRSDATSASVFPTIESSPEISKASSSGSLKCSLLGQMPVDRVISGFGSKRLPFFRRHFLAFVRIIFAPGQKLENDFLNYIRRVDLLWRKQFSPHDLPNRRHGGEKRFVRLRFGDSNFRLVRAARSALSAVTARRNSSKNRSIIGRYYKNHLLSMIVCREGSQSESFGQVSSLNFLIAGRR